MLDKGRRDFICLIGGVAVGWPLAARAQQRGKLPTIGFLGQSTRPAASEWVAAFVQRLHELGWFEGRTLAIEYRWAEGLDERYAELAAEFVRLKVDVIVTSGTPAVMAAQRATSTIPIIFATAGDPVGNNLVASLARPGGNVTGLSTLGADLAGKRLELLKEVVPGVSRIAVLSNPTNQSVPALLSETEIAAQSLGVQIQFLEARVPNELNKVFVAIKDRPSALMVMPDPMLFAQRKRLSDLAGESRLPTMAEWEEFVQAGGLMSY